MRANLLNQFHPIGGMPRSRAMSEIDQWILASPDPTKDSAVGGIVTGDTSESAGVAVGDRNGLVPLVAARFRPPLMSFQVVDRRRLVDTMRECVSTAPLTLISAPAGAGKTTVAAAWAADPDRTMSVAWLTVDERDDQPGVFWSHVLGALALNGLMPAGTMRPTHPDVILPSFVEMIAVELLAREQPVVLVLDDAERLKDRQVAGQLDLLMRSAWPQFRLVVVTRSEPVLPLHRYRLEETVAEIRSDALAFTASEVRTMLALHGVEASDLTTQALVARTEGWAAGLRLATLALQHTAAGTSAVDQIEAVLGPKDSVLAEYLIAEVLQHMPRGIREFLLRTSVVREICPDLANELTGRSDGEQVLVVLSHSNVFVNQVTGSPGFYRTHPLFRELLAAQLGQESPAALAFLHRRAARWFAAAGRVTEAAEHAVAAGDWGDAARFVVGGMAVGTLLAPTSAGTGMAKLLSLIPDDVESAEISVVRAALALTQGDIEHARRCLVRCVEHLSSAGTDLLLAAGVVRTQLCDASGDTDATIAAARSARDALRTLSAEQAAQHQDLWALVLGSEGTAHLRAGDFDQARASLAEALVASAATGCEPQRLRCLALLALTEVCRGRLSHGQELADTAERFAVESGVVAAERPAAAHLAQAWVALERQDLSGAQHWLARAIRLSEAQTDDMLASVSTLLRVRLRHDRGDIEGARRLLGSSVARVPWLHAALEAEAVALEGVTDGGVENEPREVAVETPSAKVEHLLMRARRHCARGDLGAGRLAVMRAMALAEDERIRRPFAHVPLQIRLLIRTDPAISVLAVWLRPEHNGPRRRQPAQANAAQVDQALSEKELEVLRHLSALLTTEEIAAAMFISVNTVKTHVRAILRKLSVSRRNEAVRRARELGIV
jgi:LuxR family maltose regulon positive regulatory protein